MTKPILGLLLGGIVGVFDGLSALVSAPETAPQIAGIVAGSTVKGLITGVLIGVLAKKLKSLPLGMVTGALIGLVIAMPIAIANKFYWQIMLPGTVLGLIVGYATQRYGAPRPQAGQNAERSSAEGDEHERAHDHVGAEEQEHHLVLAQNPGSCLGERLAVSERR